MTVLMFMEGLFLLAAAISDSETGEVEIRYTGGNALFLFLYLVSEGDSFQISTSLICAGLLFIVLIAGAVFGGLGGADVIVCSSLPFILGFNALWVVFLSFALTIPFLLYTGGKREYAFIPYVFIAYNIILSIT